MLQQQGKHVYALTTTPRRGQTHPAPQPPKGILKPSSSSHSQSTIASPNLMSSASSSSSSPSAQYDKREWSLINIARAASTPSSSQITSPNGSNLTVTLLYYPSMTLFAWPFNLSRPDAKGVCYETAWIDEEQGVPRVPPADAMSTSLRVLTDVIRCWMKVRKSRSTAQRTRTSGESSGSSTPLDGALDNEEVVEKIVELIGLRDVAPLERAAHLVRQQLPSIQHVSHQESRHSTTSSIDSHMSVESEDRRRSRPESIASSRASTVESSPEQVQRVLKAGKLPAPPLGRLVTSSSAPDGLRYISLSEPANHSTKRPPPLKIPEIKLHEPTPLDSEYAERDRVLLGQPRGSVSRKSSYSNSMDTVQEVAREEINRPSADIDSDDVVKVHPCDVVATPPLPQEVAPSFPRDSNKLEREAGSSPRKPFFRVPFRTRTRSPPK